MATETTKSPAVAKATASSPTTAAATSELQSSLRELHIGEKTSSITDIPRPKLTASTALPARKKKASVVADSWEDEADLSDQDTDNAGAGLEDELGSPDVAASLAASPAVAEGPLDPPPTPISPQTSQPWIANAVATAAAAGGYGPDSASRSRPTSASTSARDPNRRPEKQTAVAGRLIAGALGIRAPKRTEEQRAYDRAVKEQEIRRRNKEREEAAKAKEEEEKAKVAVWDE